MNRQPVAYIRRSAADAGSPGDISREVQEVAVRELAHRDGFNGDVEYFVDWARSADEEKSEKRTAYAAMLERVESGKVSHVYAYALDRLNRSLVMSARFAKACEAKDVKIITQREGEVRQDSPAEWLRWTMLATFAEYELRTIKTRAATALQRRRDNGDHLGQARYGYKHARNDAGVLIEVRDESIDLDIVRDAYKAAGSVLGACTLLRERGIPAPKGGTRWATSALTRILEREWPELLPQKAPSGKRTPASAMFSHLLRCPFCDDHRPLTPNVNRGQYYCARGPADRATHPRYTVREVDLMDWMVAEADKFDIPYDAAALEGTEADQARLQAERAYIIDNAIVMRLDRDDLARRLAAVDAKLEALQGRAALATIAAAVDWNKPAGVVNAALRAMWRGVNLGPDLLPLSADRIVEEWWRA